MRTVEVASGNYIEQTVPGEQSKVGIGYYIDDVDALVHALREVSLVDPYGRILDPQVYVERKIKHGAIDIGKRQQFGILSAAARIVPDDKNLEGAADILRNSHPLAYLFGQIADRPHAFFDLTDKTNSELVVLDVHGDPDRYLDYAAPNNRVQFSQEGVDRIRPHLRKGMGCPALKQMVQLPEGKATLVAVSWAANTEDFIHDYVLSGASYTYETEE